jgi:hypothetical protein
MNTIPDTFTQDGLHFTLLDRNGDVAVYHRQNHKHVMYEIMTVDQAYQGQGGCLNH